MATLCIDAGTTLIKAVIFDDEGREVSVSSQATAVLKPEPNMSEQDMDEVWETVVQVSRQALASAGESFTVEHVAITAQGDGAWIIDPFGKPVRNAILWNDGRSAKEIETWSEAGVLDRAFELNGSLTSLGLPNAILAHLQTSEPSTLARGNKVLTCGSWIYFKFTELIGLHVSEASAPWLDIHTGEISVELLNIYGLAHLRELIPEVFSADQSTAQISDKVASMLGLTGHVSVTLAPYDIVTTATGCGLTEEGQAYAILGTTLCPGTLVDSPQLATVTTGLNLFTGTEGKFLRAFPTLTGAGAFDWICSVLGVQLEELTALAAGSAPGANGVVVLPYFSPAGERAPFLNVQARGTILGATFQTTQADIARAFFESLANVIRECLSSAEIKPTSIAISGGGARNSLLCQIIADVTGVMTTRTLDTQVGSKGALMYSAIARSEVKTLEEAKRKYVNIGDTFVPAQEHSEVLNQSFKQFVNVRDALLKSVWH